MAQYKPRKTKFVVKYFVVVPAAGARAAAAKGKSRASKVVEMTRAELNLVLDYKFEAEPAHDGGEDGAAAAELRRDRRRRELRSLSSTTTTTKGRRRTRKPFLFSLTAR